MTFLAHASVPKSSTINSNYDYLNHLPDVKLLVSYRQSVPSVYFCSTAAWRLKCFFLILLLRFISHSTASSYLHAWQRFFLLPHRYHRHDQRMAAAICCCPMRSYSLSSVTLSTRENPHLLIRNHSRPFCTCTDARELLAISASASGGSVVVEQIFLIAVSQEPLNGCMWLRTVSAAFKVATSVTHADDILASFFSECISPRGSERTELKTR